jgi:NhaP-type Na+/H+ or K+/H+ antiporter
VGLGALIGGAISKIVQQVHEPLIEITLMTIAAYGSFIAAEGAQASGKLASNPTSPRLHRSRQHLAREATGRRRA